MSSEPVFRKAEIVGTAYIIELGHYIAEHKVSQLPDGELRIQGKPLINWVYEVANHCTAIDEVRIVVNRVTAVFNLDRNYEPTRVTMIELKDGRNTTNEQY